MCYYVYADHAQYTIKTYAKMSLFALDLTGPLSKCTVRPPIFAAARSLARQFCSPKSILTGAPRAAAGSGHWLALVRALAARDPARARSQLRARPRRMATRERTVDL